MSSEKSTAFNLIPSHVVRRQRIRLSPIAFLSHLNTQQQQQLKVHDAVSHSECGALHFLIKSMMPSNADALSAFKFLRWRGNRRRLSFVQFRAVCKKIPIMTIKKRKDHPDGRSSTTYAQNDLSTQKEYRSVAKFFNPSGMRNGSPAVGKKRFNTVKVLSQHVLLATFSFIFLCLVCAIVPGW